jgi:hypothetical protein
MLLTLLKADNMAALFTFIMAIPALVVGGFMVWALIVFLIDVITGKDNHW